ncbi:MAG: thiamine ABC transporter substrate-binding protein [bacterium]|nr:thiamine ABC transporter substrate-binding protein [bacterium]
MKNKSFTLCICTLLSLSFLSIKYAKADVNTSCQLNVYATYKLPKRMASQLKTFEQTQNCKVKWRTFSDTPSLAMRLRLEGDASEADVVLGIDTLFSESLRDFLRPLENIQTDFEKTADLPEDEKLQPYLLAPLAVVCRGQDFAPTSFKDLLNTLGDNQFLFQDPRTSLPGIAFLAWINNSEESPERFWNDLSPKVLTVTKGWSHSYGLFSQGQGKCVVSYASADPYHRSKGENDIHALRFDRHPLQVMVTGITTATQIPEKAQALINFFLTTNMQKAMASDNWMWPLNAASVPGGFPDLKTFNPFWIDPEEVEVEKASWIDTWQEYLR